eukprot:TRINITY_DN3120_c0_g5_i1.p1 TRINITY_DN3120_c0_g5~~TRINITY_DN3120_c0_g5_i1.p1  ORF type:complete len:741 (+),score=76.00 TRINITY_DN3120_c0_g5_i1:51-2273(+)
MGRDACAQHVLLGALLSCCAAVVAEASCETWYESTSHGAAFRSVKDFGAVGDGVADDTLAIQAAIDFDRGTVGAKSPAIVYVPAGEYLVSDTIVLPYFTTFVGNSACPPLLRLAPGAANFTGRFGYRPLITTWNAFNVSATNHSWWLDPVVPNLFYMQVRHFRLDLRGNPGAVGILWGVAQQSALRDVFIDARGASIALDVGGGCGYAPTPSNRTYCHGAGGGGAVEDVVLRGGRLGLRFSASQWFFRNISVSEAEDSCLQNEKMAWSFTFLNLAASRCPIGFRYANGANVQIVDSSFSQISNDVAIVTDSASGLFLSRVSFFDVTWGVDKSLVGQQVVQAWAQGVVMGSMKHLKRFQPWTNSYGLIDFPMGVLPSMPRPTFADTPILNARDYALGDGIHDDTEALQTAMLLAANEGKVLFLPHGTYLVSGTLNLPPGSILVGEGLTRVELAESTPSFDVCSSSTPVVLASKGDVTLVDMMITSRSGNCAELLRLGTGAQSRLFDVHLLAEHKTQNLLHIQGPAYVDNVWGWTADHNLSTWEQFDPPIESYEGLDIEGEGPIYLYSTCFEHSLHYQYRFRGSNFTALQMQTENPYFGTKMASSVPVSITNNATGIVVGMELLSWFSEVPGGVTVFRWQQGLVNIAGYFTVRMDALVNGEISVPLPAGTTIPFNGGGYWSRAIAVLGLSNRLVPDWIWFLQIVLTIVFVVLLIVVVCLVYSHSSKSTESAVHSDVSSSDYE